MSHLRKSIVTILAKEGWVLNEDDIYPATGFWRTSHLSDVCRWEAFAVQPDSNVRIHLMCWQTMTSFVNLAKNNGFIIEHDEINAKEH